MLEALPKLPGRRLRIGQQVHEGQRQAIGQYTLLFAAVEQVPVTVLCAGRGLFIVAIEEQWQGAVDCPARQRGEGDRAGEAVGLAHMLHVPDECCHLLATQRQDRCVPDQAAVVPCRVEQGACLRPCSGDIGQRQRHLIGSAFHQFHTQVQFVQHDPPAPGPGTWQQTQGLACPCQLALAAEQIAAAETTQFGTDNALQRGQLRLFAVNRAHPHPGRQGQRPRSGVALSLV
ncbi:hypothetical protein D3C80_1091180 [compost metagenome]